MPWHITELEIMGCTEIMKQEMMATGQASYRSAEWNSNDLSSIKRARKNVVSSAGVKQNFQMKPMCRKQLGISA